MEFPNLGQNCSDATCKQLGKAILMNFADIYQFVQIFNINTYYNIWLKVCVILRWEHAVK
jgi:hypothetical protein